MEKVAEIIESIEKFAPLNTAAEWDNSGWQINLDIKETNKIFLTLNVNTNIVEQAIDNNCDLIISHHPLIFTPLAKIQGGFITKAIQNKIQIYSAHTNLDVATGGTTDKLAQKAGFEDCLPLNEYVKYKFLEEEILLESFIEDLKKNLCLEDLRLTNWRNKQKIKSIAFCAGSGSSFVEEVKYKGIDLYITADIKYHDALDADKLILLDIGHFNSEKFVCEIFKDILKEKRVEVVVAHEKNVWQTL